MQNSNRGGGFKHYYLGLNSIINGMDTEGPEEEGEEDEEPGRVVDAPASQLTQGEERQEDGKPNRPTRACKQDKGYHHYVKTG